ncbi:MAG TPA: heparan-alpha-glucosaminide N-acetyltransferase [Ottowia sp.]|uniref:heparan-alpha-glucosaminide N-acetyltransferase n=1 Tax=Ottowia sp. TaxID=1898956 RepID=UPI002C533A9B|nr:heparan-alpha-glucosaminide N-acetyltransferase [Ottowia sp.]HMN21107.1 heparan-alpha-glucosaminide N-acetyltransferase [Ottowia sp.]
MPTRLDRLDALRGLALAWMTAYHFGFDLNHFGLIQQDFYNDPIWTGQRTAIVGLFLFTAGFGQVLAVQAGQGWPRFWRRWRQVAACALLVSLASWWMFPRSWISFGVLHALALLLLLVRALLMRGWLGGPWPWLLALGLLGATPLLRGLLVAADAPTLAAALDSRWLYGLGIVTHKPVTEDYVPLLPWLGVLLLGVGAGQRLPRAWLQRPVPVPARGLAVLGRWSLSWYMLHQPVLIGGLMAWLAWRG